MAVRIDFFSVVPGIDLERSDVAALIGDPGHAPDAPVRWEGHVAADDDHENALVELARQWGSHGVLDGVEVQGVADQARTVSSSDAAALLDIEVPADVDAGGLAREWATAAARCVSAAVASDRHLGWWTRYDDGGSVDAGSEEWSSGSSVRG